jgi:hypothetical protein
MSQFSLFKSNERLNGAMSHINTLVNHPLVFILLLLFK